MHQGGRHKIGQDHAFSSVRHWSCGGRGLSGQGFGRAVRIEVDEATLKPLPSYGGIAFFQVEGSSYQSLGTVETGLVPIAILSQPDGRRAFVSNILDGTASVIDMTTLSVEKTLEVDAQKRQDKVMHQGAHGLALI